MTQGPFNIQSWSSDHCLFVKVGGYFADYVPRFQKEIPESRLNSWISLGLWRVQHGVLCRMMTPQEAMVRLQLMVTCPWAHRWHGPRKTHLCRRENVPANSHCQIWARWPSQKPPTPTCHDMTRHANVITWHDMYHFISFHPLPSESFQVCLFMHPDLWYSAGEAWWCVHRGYQITSKYIQT